MSRTFFALYLLGFAIFPSWADNLEVRILNGKSVIKLEKDGYLRLPVIGGGQLQFWGPGELVLPVTMQSDNGNLDISNGEAQSTVFLKSGHLRISSKREHAREWRVQTPFLTIRSAEQEMVADQWEVLINVFPSLGETISEVCSLQGASYLGIQKLQLPSHSKLLLLATQFFSSRDLSPGVKIEAQNSLRVLEPEVVEFLLSPSGQNDMISPLSFP